MRSKKSGKVCAILFLSALIVGVTSWWAIGKDPAKAAYDEAVRGNCVLFRRDTECRYTNQIGIFLREADASTGARYRPTQGALTRWQEKFNESMLLAIAELGGRNINSAAAQLPDVAVGEMFSNFKSTECVSLPFNSAPFKIWLTKGGSLVMIETPFHSIACQDATNIQCCSVSNSEGFICIRVGQSMYVFSSDAKLILQYCPKN